MAQRMEPGTPSPWKKPTRMVEWWRYADGETWVLRQGVDFDEPPTVMRYRACNFGSAYGYETHTSCRAGQDTLYVQFVDTDGWGKRKRYWASPE